MLSGEPTSSSTTPPVVLPSFRHAPSYPLSLARGGIEGTTVVLVHVLTDGTPAEVKVEQSAGHAALDQAAVDALRQWRFEPGRRDGGTIAMWIRVPMTFAAPRRCAVATGLGAGIVTRVEGESSVRRVALPAPARLQVDAVLFVEDTVVTSARARVEMRLGCDLEAAFGEQSAVTITERPGVSTLDLQAGQVEFRVPPGFFPPRGSIVPPGVFTSQRIQIATPNVIVVVRDAVRMFVDTRPSTSPGSAGASRVDVLDGITEVIISGIAPRRTITINANESLTITGAMAEPIRALAR